MIIGYARTSTVEQVAGLEAQIDELRRHGCEKLFTEQVSSVDASRPQLTAALEFAREGDTLVVTKLDRLARSVAHLIALVEQFAAKGVGLRVLDLGIDTTSPTGKLMLSLLGAIAEFERAIMLDHQRVGIAKAKAEGKYRGRAPTARRKAEEVRALAAGGVRAAEIAARVGISKASVYRLLSAAS
jgi:DNA invertase Pin-like site-specific DNA recombinase